MCHKCGKLGHYKAVCQSKVVRPGVGTVKLQSSDDNFLGPVYASDVSAVQSDNKWTKRIEVNGWVITLKVDTGADVTVIPQDMYSETQDGPLQPSKRQLTGAGCQPLDVQGHFKGYLKHKDTETAQNIFVICGLSKPLLGHPAIEALTIVT